ncbi:hypothetical protein EV126DRAFT_480443 [Verticillium dahliae]|nr:hypothetical protein EV126DRAFT_480443 [Verticillium dahliae]
MNGHSPAADPPREESPIRDTDQYSPTETAFAPITSSSRHHHKHFESDATYGEGNGLQRRDSTLIMEEGDRRELRRIATAMSQRRRQSLASLPEGQVPDSFESDAMDLRNFDLKNRLLYEGREIFYGRASDAKAYFEGWAGIAPSARLLGDFLTSVTTTGASSAQRHGEQGAASLDEFERYWLASPEFEALRREIEEHQQEFPIDAHGQTISEMREKKNIRQSRHVRPKSPYTSVWPCRSNSRRNEAYQRIWNDFGDCKPCSHAARHCSYIGSVFHQNPDTTAGLFGKGSVLFQAT